MTKLKLKGKLILQVTSIDESGSLNVNVRQGLLKAREVVLVVTGANKREVVKNFMKKMVNLALNHLI